MPIGYYDFILFENYQLATHHLYDVMLIAKLLKSQGANVAIFDLYNQLSENEVKGIHVIKWEPKSQLPDVEWMQRQHSKWETLSKFHKYTKQRNRYLKEAKKFIIDHADNFYCGSLYNGMPTLFFDIKKPCYWWGLRSSRMRIRCKEMFQSPITAINKAIERFNFIRNPFQRLFVSNAIILEEFVNIGIDRERIVIREERCISSIGTKHLDKMTPNISFLVIGMLRPEKHIPLTVSAFKAANIPDSMLFLIGRSSAGYEPVIEDAIAYIPHILRQNKYLEYDDFNQAFQKSHFVLFADEEGSSCITNGTLTEALINHRPVICPNCQPYKHYIEKFGVGLTYEAGDVASYATAIKEAYRLGVNYFMENIDDFLSTIQFDIVGQELMKSINNINSDE